MNLYENEQKSVSNIQGCSKEFNYISIYWDIKCRKGIFNLCFLTEIISTHYVDYIQIDSSNTRQYKRSIFPAMDDNG